MAIRTQKNIQSMVLHFLVRKEEAWRTGVSDREVEVALTREFEKGTDTAWRRRLSYAKAFLVKVGTLTARRDVWLLRECPYLCDDCFTPCHFTGFHVDRHRCKKHHRRPSR